jgi:hypothetical protein
MSQLAAPRTINLPKYARIAARVRAQIAEGVLAPGESAPSGAELARVSGYSQLTCRKALRSLIKEGVLVPGPSPNARPRVACPTATPGEKTLADAGRALSAALAIRRRSMCLTQSEFAGLIGVSVTTVGHAETGRLWQSRKFWACADKALMASGKLLSLHDAYRAAVLPPDPTVARIATVGGPLTTAPTNGTVICITITWDDGTVMNIRPPER